MEQELEEIRRRAACAPGDLGLGDALLAAFGRAGRLEEGAVWLRNLLVRGRRGPAREREYLALLRRHGHGIGDPGFQHGAGYREARAPDGRHLAVIEGARLVVYATVRGEVRILEAGPGPIDTVAWSGDSRGLLVAGWLGAGELGLTRYRLDRRLEAVRGRVRLPGIAPAGARILVDRELAGVVVVGRDGAVARARLRTAGGGLEAAVDPYPAGSPAAGFAGASLSPAGEYLLTWQGTDAVSAGLLDLGRGSWLTAGPTPGRAREMLWSADGRRGAVALEEELEPPTQANPFDDEDRGSPGTYRARVLVLDPAAGRGLGIDGPPREGNTRPVGFRPDGLLGISGTTFDPATGAAVDAPPLEVRAEPRRARVGAGASISGAIAWAALPFSDASRPREAPSRRPLVHERPLVSLQLAGDGRRLLTVEGRAKGVVWEVATGLPLLRTGAESAALGLARDGSAWVGAGKGYRVVPVERPEAALVVPVRPYQPPHQGHYELVDLAPDGRSVAVHGWPWGIEILPLGSAQPRASLDRGSSACRSLRYVAGGARVVVLRFPSVAQPTLLQVYRAEDLAELESFEVGVLDYGAGDADLAELPGDAGILVGVPGGPLACRSGTGRALRLVDRPGATGRFALAPDGRQLALAVPGGIELWDLGASPRCAARIETPLGAPRGLAFSPDGESLWYTQACHVRMAARA